MPDPIEPLDLEDAVLDAGDLKKTEPPAASSEVTVNGVKYIVTPELAAAMEKETSSAAQREQDLQERVRLSQQPAPVDTTLPPQQTVEQGYTKIGDRIFEEPDAVLSELEKRIEDKLQKKYEAAEAEKERISNQSKAVDNFYSDFAKEHKELKEDMPLVKTILQSNYSKWSHLSEKELSKTLADEASKTILRHTKQEVTPELGVVLESGGQAVEGVIPKAKDDDAGPKSLTDVIKARQKARREHTSLKV